MKRKLLSLNTYHYRRGGSEAVYFDHDALFRQAGWETAVFAMHHPQNEPSPWSQYFADELEFGNAYGMIDKLVMAGKVIYSWEARKKLARLLDEFTPDIAHGHLLYHHLSPSVVSLLHDRGIPTVMTAHDLKLACPAYTMFNRTGVCERCINGNVLNVIKYRCVRDSLVTSGLVAVESGIHKALGLWKKNLDRVIAPSNFYRNKLIEWGWPEKQVTYIPNYIDSEAYEPQYAPGDYFFYFGRLTKQKGVETLIRAVADSGLRLLLAGTGPDEAYLKSLVPARTNRIEFLGYCTGDRLKQLIREARAVVLPSVGYENAPISILEAYASGKPVIGSAIGGIPELIREGTGMTFQSGYVEKLTDCLQRFFDLPAGRIQEMGQEARALVSQEFTSARYFDRMLALYRELLPSTGKGVSA